MMLIGMEEETDAQLKYILQMLVLVSFTTLVVHLETTQTMINQLLSFVLTMVNLLLLILLLFLLNQDMIICTFLMGNQHLPHR